MVIAVLYFPSVVLLLASLVLSVNLSKIENRQYKYFCTSILFPFTTKHDPYAIEDLSNIRIERLNITFSIFYVFLALVKLFCAFSTLENLLALFKKPNFQHSRNTMDFHVGMQSDAIHLVAPIIHTIVLLLDNRATFRISNLVGRLWPAFMISAWLCSLSSDLLFLLPIAVTPAILSILFLILFHTFVKTS